MSPNELIITIGTLSMLSLGSFLFVFGRGPNSFGFWWINLLFAAGISVLTLAGYVAQARVSNWWSKRRKSDKS